MTSDNPGAPEQQEAEAPQFQAVRQRLEEIADAVADPELSLDAALDLYEEAVTLGLQASDLLEVDITAEEEQAAALEAASDDAARAASADESREGAAEAPSDGASPA